MKKKLLIILTGFSIGLSAQTGLTNNGVLISVGGSSSDAKPNLFVPGKIQVGGNGSFLQKGGMTLTGDFVSNVTSGNVFDSNSDGWVEFSSLINGQKITRTIARDKNLFISFPNVKINNPNAVLLDAFMGMSVDILSLNKGRFIVDSRVIDRASTENAHLYVRKYVDYARNAVARNDKGLVQVNLAVGDNYQTGKLIGFTPPFKSIYADYFCFNFLSRPSAVGLTGDSRAFITDPTYVLDAGKGYIIGQGIIRDNSTGYYSNVNKAWASADYSKRATTMFSFAREFAEPTFTQTIDLLKSIASESLNTKSIQIPLEAGWNYLGNPFTTPLDMSSFLNETSSVDDWGVTRSAGSTGGGDVRNSFYVMSGGNGTYDPNNLYTPFNVAVNYMLAQKVGSTLVMDGTSTTKVMLAPMQMFVIGAYDKGNKKTFTIPENKRTHGDVKYYKSAMDANEIIDEMLIEVKDVATAGFDRLSVVFRDNATLKSDDMYDSPKLFSQSNSISQIYTMSSDDKKMTANIISPQTSSLVMCLKPSSVKQQLALTTARMNTLKSVDNVVLEDKFTGKKVDLKNTANYTFTSSPTDKEDRFVLHFTRSTTGIDQVQQSDAGIYLFYADNNLKVSGLSTSDEGSSLSIIDLFGRTVYQTSINETPQLDIPVNLVQGAYIVKLSGLRSYTTKILVK